MAYRETNPLSLAKAILWEEAKGKLRAIVQAEGQRIDRVEPPPYQAIGCAVEAFIKKFESEGFHE